METLRIRDAMEGTRKLTRRERENMRQRAEIFEAALRLFSEKGFHNVSMSQIASEAEFGMGTLYKFFENKENLYKALLMEMAEQCHNQMMNAIRAEHDPISAIRKYVTTRHEIFFNNLELMRLYFAETTGASYNLKAGLDRDLLKFYDELIEELALIFERGIGDKVFRAVDPYNMALALEGAINAVLWRLMDNPDRLRNSKDLPIIADLFFRGVLIQEAPGLEPDV